MRGPEVHRRGNCSLIAPGPFDPSRLGSLAWGARTAVLVAIFALVAAGSVSAQDDPIGEPLWVLHPSYWEGARFIREACDTYTRDMWYREFSGAPSPASDYRSRYREAAERLGLEGVGFGDLPFAPYSFTPSGEVIWSQAYIDRLKKNQAAINQLESLWSRAENSVQRQLDTIFLAIYNPYGFSRSIGSGHGEPAGSVDGLTDVDRTTYPILVRKLSYSKKVDAEMRDLLAQQLAHISVRAAQVRIAILAIASSMCTEADPTGVLRQQLLITREYVKDVVFLIQSVLQPGSAGQIVVR